MREEARGPGVVNSPGVRSGMLSSLARMVALYRGRRLSVSLSPYGRIYGLKIKNARKALYINRAWRRRQSSANLSPPMNSLLQGKIQGILAVLSRIGRSCCRYASIFASDLDQIPCVQEQEIFATKHGPSTREQGGDSAAAGNESDLLRRSTALTCSFRKRLATIVPT
jgi:hypothetical protein